MRMVYILMSVNCEHMGIPTIYFDPHIVYLLEQDFELFAVRISSARIDIYEGSR